MDIDALLSDVDKVLENADHVDPLLLRQILEGLETGLSFVLGVIVLIIIIGIPLVTALDIAYISLPVFRNSVSNLNFGDHTKIRFISNDAVKAIEHAYMTEKGSALGVYLRKRCVSYVIVACLITIIFLGGWDYILMWVQYFAVVIMDILLEFKTAI